MKKPLWLLVLALMFAILPAACGGASTAPEAQVDEATAAVVDDSAAIAVEPVAAEELVEDVAEEVPETDEPTEEAVEPEAEPVTEPVADADGSNGMQMSGVDADTGLEINPAQIAAGVDYIIRGRLTSFNLTPQESPEFLIETPDGLRFRIKSQPVPEIFFDDGSQLLPHEYKRGILAQGTARLEESARATSVMLSPNLTLMVEAP